MKRRIVAWFLKHTDEWNHEVHNAIESRVIAAYKAMFPNGHSDNSVRESEIRKMREFYYARMMTTANLVVAGAAALIAAVALVVSVIALKT